MIKNIIYKINRKKIKIAAFALLFVILFFAVLLLISTKISILPLIIGNRFTPHEEVTLNQDFEYEIYFNNEETNKIFSNTIIENISAANTSIEMAIYSIDLKDVISTLKQKSNEGIAVTLVVPTSKIQKYQNLFNDSKVNLIGVGNVQENGENLMHHKFILIDAEGVNKKILFGGTNFTGYQEKYDSSYLMETADSEIISTFKKEFDLLSNGKNGFNKFFDSNYYVYSKKINYNNGFIELWFGPGTKKYSIKDRMIDLISQSKKSIQIIIWNFTDNDLYREILKSAGLGVTTKIITDDSNIWSSESVIKKNSIIETVSDSFTSLKLIDVIKKDSLVGDDFKPYIHHHFMIVDDSILLTGTNNWSEGGFYLNDESILVTNISSLIKEFSDVFNMQYKVNKNKTLNFELTGDSKIIIHDDIPSDSKIILFLENSEIEQIDKKICFEGVIPKNKELPLPQICDTDKTIIFVVDKNTNLLSSAYLR